MSSGRAGYTGYIYGLAIPLLLALCVAPVIAAFLPLILSPGESLRLSGELLTSPRLWGLWTRSCGIALGTALTATALGLAIGTCLNGPGLKRRRWLYATFAVPFLLPPHVLAVAWIDVLGQQGLLESWGIPTFSLYSTTGVIWVQCLTWYPIPMLLVVYRLQQIDPHLWESAQILSEPGPIFRRITLPLLYPALSTGFLAVFIFSLLSFSVPSLLQVPVFTVEIYSSFNSLLDQRQAVLLSAPMLLTGGFLACIALRRGHALLPTLPRGNQGMAAGTHYNRWSACFLALFFGIAVVLPTLAMLYRIGAPHVLLSAWRTGAGEIGTSVLLGGLGATLLLVLVLPMTLLVPSRPAPLLWTSLLAYLVSGPVFGIGLIQVWNHAGPTGYLYDRFPILLIAVLGRYALFAWLGCHLVAPWLPPDTLSAARNLGSGKVRTFLTITLPALRKPLAGVWACLFLLILGELECIVLVAPPGWVPVSLRIFTLMHYGPTSMVSALALLQTIVTALVLYGLAACIGRNKVYTPDKSRYHTVGR